MARVEAEGPGREGWDGPWGQAGRSQEQAGQRHHCSLTKHRGLRATTLSHHGGQGFLEAWLGWGPGAGAIWGPNMARMAQLQCLTGWVTELPRVGGLGEQGHCPHMP